jgi:primosomal protein N' (replication factor Y)
VLRAEAARRDLPIAFLEHALGLALGLAHADVELLGPAWAPMERRAGRYRAQLLVQAAARAPLHRLLASWLLELEQMPSGRAVRWSLDVDPVDLY